MEKIIRLSIENTTKIRQVEDSFCELYSHDKNNGAFEFEISKGTHGVQATHVETLVGHD